MHDLARKSFEAGLVAARGFMNTQLGSVVAAAEVIASALSQGGKLLIFGNGGSAADAQHLAAEFVNRYLLERPPLPALALTTDTSVLTSISNDYSFHDVFAKQVRAFGQKGDVALGISTSGRSPNVVRALAEARNLEMRTIALVGQAGQEAGAQADVVISVEADETPRIQEVHLIVEHVLCELVEARLFTHVGRSI
jgi:D-sedoheptulose 7-phosphate isomerase